MNKFFCKISLFLILVMVTCLIIEIMIRQIPNEYRYKKKYLDNESENIEVLFLGASDAQSGFNPAYSTRNSFNAAHPAQSLDYSFEILKKYKNKWSKLEYIVLTVSYPTLFYKIEASGEPWRVKNYRIYYKMSISKNLRSYAELMNGQLFEHILRLSKFYVKKIDEINCTDHGWYISSTSEPSDSLVISGMKAAKRQTIPSDQKCFGEMKSALDSIIGFSKRNKCNLILCTPPVYKSYRENLDKYQLDTSINTFVKTVEENHNCTYINLFDDARFKDEDFLDGDHLNGNGARKLTLMIDSLINTIKMVNE